MDIKKVIGLRINEILGESNMRQKDLAKILGVTDNTISYYCKGARAPQVEQLPKIAEALNTTTDYLLGITKDRRKEPSIYDSIGLSEKSITILRVAQESVNSVVDHEKLSKLLPKREIFEGLDICGDIDPETMEQSINAIYQHLSRSFCGELAKYFPEFIDLVIEVSTDNPIVIENFSQIVNPDKQPVGIERIMSQDEFVRFKIFEITNYINNRLLEWFENYRRDFSGND